MYNTRAFWSNTTRIRPKVKKSYSSWPDAQIQEPVSSKHVVILENVKRHQKQWEAPMQTLFHPSVDRRQEGGGGMFFINSPSKCLFCLPPPSLIWHNSVLRGSLLTISAVSVGLASHFTEFRILQLRL